MPANLEERGLPMALTHELETTDLKLPSVTVVVPAYNEGERLPAFLEQLARIGLAYGRPTVELIVVDDGSSAPHTERYGRAVFDAVGVLRAARSAHTVRLLTSPGNQGKGAAIRRGWEAASPHSDWLGFVDADGAVCPAEFWRLAAMLAPDAPFDVLCGSRVLMAGRSIRRSQFRHVQGRIFATLVEHWFRLGFYDTQCGVKFVRARALRLVSSRLRERGWLLDVEMLTLLNRAGARAVEEPIDWADPGGSKVRFGIDPARMLLGLWRMHRRLAAGYDDAQGPAAPSSGAAVRRK